MRIKKLALFFTFKFVRFFRMNKINYDTAISYGGFVVSIAVLTASLALLSGYRTALKDGILGVNGHLYFYNSNDRSISPADIQFISEFLAKQPEVKSFNPVLMTNAMVSSENTNRLSEEGEQPDEVSGNQPKPTQRSRVIGVLVRSQDWQRDALPTNYHQLISAGTSRLTGENDAVIGEKLAQYLGVGIGDRIRLNGSANVRFTLFGLRTSELIINVVGLYRSGIYETDSKTVFLNERAVRSLASASLSDENYNFIEVAVYNEHTDDADLLSIKWGRMLEYRYRINSWIDYNGNLFTMLVVQRQVIFIILMFIVLIASFGIASNTAKTLMEKKREIGILAAIGADNALIRSYLMGETAILGLISIIAGILLGIVTAWGLTKQTVLMLKGDVYFIDSFSPEVNATTIILIAVVSLSIALFSSYFGMNRISRLTVIERF